MDQIAFSWLVYDLTHSAFHLVLVNVVRSIPILVFTLIAGAVADRMERRKLMVFSQIAMMAIAIVLCSLMTFDALALWMIYAIAASRGIANSFNQPARQALISDLVPRQDLPSAVALNSTTFNLSKTLGPALSGVLIATLGVTGAFYLNTLSIAVALYCLTIMHFPPAGPRREHSQSMATDMVDAFRYLKREKALLTLVILALVPLFLGQPYQTMLTVFARDVFVSGSISLGAMQSTAAVGALIGIFFVASSGGSDRRFISQMMGGIVVYGAALAVFSFSPSIMVAIPALLVAGIAQQTYQTSNNTMIQLNVAAEYRGRVLSTLYLQRGMVPLGTILVGTGTELFGPRAAMGGMAFSLLAIGVLATPIVLAQAMSLRSRSRESEATAPG